jgi:hypothetical protein
MTTDSVYQHASALTTPRALARCACAAAVCGVVAAIPVVPVVARGLLLAMFVFGGPGAAIILWARGLTPSVIAVLVPITGLAAILLLTGAAALTGVWNPFLTTALLAVASIGSALLAKRSGRTEEAS